MVTSNKNLMGQAREALSGRWGLAAGTYFVFALIIAASSSIPLAILLIGGAFELGIATFWLAIARKENAKLEMIFSGFKNFGNVLKLFLLMLLYVFLWSLLLIIPGIIAKISYAMAYFIMCDDPNIGAMEAIDKSKKMMYGYKWKYFCLCLRFIGWYILGILSFGIGLFWVVPYMEICFAKFYEDVKANYVERQ